VNLCKHHHE